MKDFFFESALVQQCLIMLVTGFEVYTITRFMEKERKRSNIEGLMKEFARKKSVKDEIEYERKINFQNWNVCKNDI